MKSSFVGLASKLIRSNILKSWLDISFLVPLLLPMNVGHDPLKVPFSERQCCIAPLPPKDGFQIELAVTEVRCRALQLLNHLRYRYGRAQSDNDM